MIRNRKAQATLEASIILLYILLILTTIWLGGPIQQSTESSTDTNGIILAALALDSVAENNKIVGLGETGTREDFVIHVPFNTVDMQYGDGSYDMDGTSLNGPHMNITILLYSNISENGFSSYDVDADGRPSWYRKYLGTPFNTSHYYTTLTKPLKYELDERYFPLCDNDARKNATEIRGSGSRLIFVDDSLAIPEIKDITFCCEAGFNVFMYMEKSPADPRKIAIRSRHYYSLPGEWKVT